MNVARCQCIEPAVKIWLPIISFPKCGCCATSNEAAEKKIDIEIKWHQWAVHLPYLILSVVNSAYRKWSNCHSGALWLVAVLFSVRVSFVVQKPSIGKRKIERGKEIAGTHKSRYVESHTLSSTQMIRPASKQASKQQANRLVSLTLALSMWM